MNGKYADCAKRAADPSGKAVRYVHNEVIEEPPPGYPFDGVIETWFANADDAAGSFADAALAPLAQQLPAFCDLSARSRYSTSVIMRFPRV